MQRNRDNPVKLLEMIEKMDDERCKIQTIKESEMCKNYLEYQRTGT